MPRFGAMLAALFITLEKTRGMPSVDAVFAECSRQISCSL